MKSKLGSKIKSRMNLKSMIIARLGGVVGGANSTNPNHYHANFHANHHPDEPASMYPPINQAIKRWFELY